MTKVSPLPAIEYDKRQQRKVLEKFDMKRYKSSGNEYKVEEAVFWQATKFCFHLQSRRRSKGILLTEYVFLCVLICILVSIFVVTH